MFAVATLHTNDKGVRKGTLNRSQTFKWYSATIMYYFLDRYFMHMTASRSMKIESAKALGAPDKGQKTSVGNHVVILKIKRPTSDIHIEIMGPYGSSVGNLSDYTDAIMIGTGTGVVPMISYLREFLGQLEMISAHHFIEQKQKTRKERFLLQRDRAAEPTFLEYASKSMKKLASLVMDMWRAHVPKALNPSRMSNRTSIWKRSSQSI
eukprot:GSChrysophyteH1.ASY1.ANO1.1240.1 assembled CDS